MRLCPASNSLATISSLYNPPDSVGLYAMSTATGQVGGRATKPVTTEKPRDLYDPHFPTQQRTKVELDRTRIETFDPHFPRRAWKYAGECTE